MNRPDKQDNQSAPKGAPRGSRRQQPGASPTAGNATGRGTRQFRTQQQKEAMYQRWLYIGLAAAATLVVLALIIGAVWQYRIFPNQTLATVDDQKISRNDYWKYQDLTFYTQARFYENLALETTGQEQSQYLLYSAQLDSARANIKDNSEVAATTVEQMIEDKLYVQAAEEQGIDMSLPVLQQRALNIWAPSDSPVMTPVPSPTLIPERAEWATQTAEAMQTQSAQAAIAAGTPISDIQATPLVAEPEATPDMAIVERNAETEYQAFVADILPDVGLNEEEFLNFFVKPLVAREQIEASITNEIPQSAPQVDLAHILVTDESVADDVYTQLEDGSLTFDDAASTYSIDTATSGNEGRLGWVAEGEMPSEVDAVAFTMTPGDISGPIESPFGWHILKVLDHDEDRALTDIQYQTRILTAKQELLAEMRGAHDISSEYYNPVAPPTPSAFVAPVNVPTRVPVTPVSAPDISGTPVAGPVFAPATPEASPVATP